MEQVVEFKSNFKNYKLALIWLVLLGVMIFPWLFLINQFDKVFAGFALLTDLIVVAIIIYQKIPIKVLVNEQERVIEYHSISLYGKQILVGINLKKADVNLGTINYRGNDLWNLIIIDNGNSKKKIEITETNGYEAEEIKSMYALLNKMSVE